MTEHGAAIIRSPYLEGTGEERAWCQAMCHGRHPAVPRFSGQFSVNHLVRLAVTAMAVTAMTVRAVPTVAGLVDAVRLPVLVVALAALDVTLARLRGRRARRRPHGRPRDDRAAGGARRPRRFRMRRPPRMLPARGHHRPGRIRNGTRPVGADNRPARLVRRVEDVRVDGLLSDGRRRRPAVERKAGRIGAEHGHPESGGRRRARGQQPDRRGWCCDRPERRHPPKRGCRRSDRLDDGDERRSRDPASECSEHPRALGALDPVEAAPELRDDDLEAERVESTTADRAVLHAPAYNSGIGRYPESDATTRSFPSLFAW